ASQGFMEVRVVSIRQQPFMVSVAVWRGREENLIKDYEMKVPVLPPELFPEKERGHMGWKDNRVVPSLSLTYGEFRNGAIQNFRHLSLATKWAIENMLNCHARGM